MRNFGIMFHHFHDTGKHIISQGSISSNEFYKMLRHLKNDYEIIDADIFYSAALNGKLKPNQICLTFDDALACQYDIAYPILEEFKIKAFWFIYTSIYWGVLERLEIYRHFRFKNFDSIERFYDAFFQSTLLSQDELSCDIEKEIFQFDPYNYLCQSSFYSNNDKLFRYLRDCVLGQEKYCLILDRMIKSSGYDMETNKDLLWIQEDQVFHLYKTGHIIGMHSHTHPTTMASKSYDEQLAEYRDNKNVLESIIGDNVFSVSYPCNSFNNNTDKIMKELGIRIGFNATMPASEYKDLHFPRKDHAYVMKEMAE